MTKTIHKKNPFEQIKNKNLRSALQQVANGVIVKRKPGRPAVGRLKRQYKMEPYLVSKIESYAKDHSTTVSSIVNQALKQFLNPL